MSQFEEYEGYDGLGLAELVRRGETTPRDLVEAAIGRIDRFDPRVNAVVVKLYESARRAADGPLPEGPFRGVPLVIKDLLTAIAGVPIGAGSRLYDGYVPTQDSELLSRYLRAGFVIVGKTNTPELGLTPVTEPLVHGPCNTPWKLGHTSGGSSGGSAAAVAARMVPIGHGGDGGGSIRIPASCCGVFGLKPTRARNPTGPDASEQWFGFAIEHVLTRSVRDSAAVLDATRGSDVGAPYVAPEPARPYLQEIGAPPGKLRIAFTTEPHLPGNVHPDCVKATRDVAKLCEELGHHVEEATPRFDGSAFARDFVTHVAVATAAEIEASEARTGRRATREHLQTDTYVIALLGRQISAVRLALARQNLHAITRSIAPFFQKYDLLLSPTMGKPPVRHGELSPKGLEDLLQRAIARADLGVLLRAPGLVERMADRVFEFVPFTPVANVTGQPSMSVPLSWNADGLPIGSMFTARFGDEATLFRLASQLEEARPWRDRRPPMIEQAR
jgi:amidase